MTAFRELERHLIEHGCERIRHDARHDVWRSSAAKRPVTVPRHREIPDGTARVICRQLGIPDPPR
ncbi:MAG: type II toxin-antitoxin system HicA family toxin [Thermoleophilia bacterium]|nr:type II toxin-antitoxin system HicA family toxin [Thermoleophilia bacterium]